MAQITISTTKEEQEAVLKVLKELRETTAPVSTIANLAGLSQSRARYAIADLLEAGKIERIPTKAFNKHYIRYSYRVLK